MSERTLRDGGPVDGVRSVMDLFTPKGGTQLGATLEAFKSTNAGKEIMDGLAAVVTNGGASTERRP